jgi:hypothetical protein
MQAAVYIVSVVWGEIIIAPAIIQSADMKKASVIKGHVTKQFLNFIVRQPKIPTITARAPPAIFADAKLLFIPYANNYPAASKVTFPPLFYAI